MTVEYIDALSADRIRLGTVTDEHHSVVHRGWVLHAIEQAATAHTTALESYALQSSVTTSLAGKQSVLSNATQLASINQALGTSSSPTFAGITVSAAPTLASQLANKAYVDSTGVTAGAGLSRTGAVVSVNSTLPHVTAVGTTSLLLTPKLEINSTGTRVLETADASSSTTGALTVAGGVGVAKNISIGGRLEWGIAHGPPAFTTRSSGTRLVLYPQLSASSTDYAVGVEGGFLWHSVPSITEGYRFYHGVTLSSSLGSNGLNVHATTDSSSVSTGAIVTAGGLGVGKTLRVGGNLHAANFFSSPLGFDPYLRQPGLTFTTTVEACQSMLVSKLCTVIFQVKIGGTVTGTATGPFQVSLNFTPRFTRPHRDSFVERNGTDTNFMIDVNRTTDVVSIKTRAGADVTAAAGDLWYVSLTYLVL